MKSPGIAGNLLLFGLALMCQAPLVKASFFTNVMSGVTKSSGTYQLGDSNDSYDYLQIDSGGALFDNAAFVGGGTGGFPGSNNTVLVTGYGSLWSRSSPGPYSLVFGGGHEIGNSLIISNGGTVLSGWSYVSRYGGGGNGGGGNNVVVTGTGSLFGIAAGNSTSGLTARAMSWSLAMVDG